MPKKIQSDPKAFAALNKLVKQHEAKGRTESAAFLIWFLRTIYRFDDVDAQDAVCDRRADMGIDALTVDDDSEEVVLFQAKRKQKLPSTLGDTDLKNFIGALTQFQSKASIEHLIATTENTELTNLLIQNKVADKIESGYTVRPIFIANVTADRNAIAFIKSAHQSGVVLDVWDLSRIAPVLAQLSREWFVNQEVKLRLSSGKSFIDGSKTSPTLLFASVSARQLVNLPGIE